MRFNFIARAFWPLRIWHSIQLGSMILRTNLIFFFLIYIYVVCVGGSGWQTWRWNWLAGSWGANSCPCCFPLLHCIHMPLALVGSWVIWFLFFLSLSFLVCLLWTTNRLFSFWFVSLNWTSWTNPLNHTLDILKKSFQDSNMFEKKKKVNWLVMFSAVWPQIMISWMI